ncbi:hypothetical protein [Arthrobacter sp. NPDC092385]|uniref:hypothetical protein n=1 Tax=Arthrobacter sp. NPDC092385 TaxID=3363943 RepID=UPI0037F5D6E4
MTDDEHRDHSASRLPRTQAVRRRWWLRSVLLLAMAVFAVSIAFVLIYATSLSWPLAILISVILVGGQVYALRRNLFGGDGEDHPDL